eukprot:3891338-Pyramimonas_sp.AAC.1
MISSIRKSVERVSKQCRSNAGRKSPRARHVKSSGFATFFVLEILSGEQGYSRLDHHMARMRS